MLSDQTGQLQKYGFCTLALGAGYSYLAKQLAHDLARFSSGSCLLVLTDHPLIFENEANVIVVPHRKRSVASYNDKLCVVKKALERFNTCIFLDADVRILGPIQLEQDAFEPGISAFRAYSWQHYVSHVLPGESPWWKRVHERMMPILRSELRSGHDGHDVPIVLESVFAVTRGKPLKSFLKQWNHLADICEKKRIFVSEGFSMGLAAFLTGFPVQQIGFRGLQFFEPLVSLEHVSRGLMTQADYDTLRESVDVYKVSTEGRFAPRALWWKKFHFETMARKFDRGYRYLKVRLFGLDLLK